MTPRKHDVKAAGTRAIATIVSLALFRSAPQPLHALCATCVVTRFSPIDSLRKSRQKAKIFENFYFGPIGPERSWNTCNCSDCVSSALPECAATFARAVHNLCRNSIFSYTFSPEISSKS